MVWQHDQWIFTCVLLRLMWYLSNFVHQLLINHGIGVWVDKMDVAMCAWFSQLFCCFCSMWLFSFFLHYCACCALRLKYLIFLCVCLPFTKWEIPYGQGCMIKAVWSRLVFASSTKSCVRKDICLLCLAHYLLNVCLCSVLQFICLFYFALEEI